MPISKRGADNVADQVCAWNDAKTFITYKMIIQEWNARFRADVEAQAKHSPSTAGIPPSSAGGAVSVRAKPPQMQQNAAVRAKHRRHATGSSGEDAEDDDADTDDTALVTAEQRLAHARARYARSKITQAKPPLTSDTCVPELIRKLEHISDVDLYRRLLHDPVFLYKQVRVCSEVASAFSKFATDPTCAADGHGLGHFLDDRPMRAKTSNLGRYSHGSKSRPSSALVRPPEEKEAPGWQDPLLVCAAMPSCRQSTGEAISEQTRGPPQLPRLTLDLSRERLAGSTAADVGRQQSTGRSSVISHRRSQDLHQHKTRLASARQKSERLSQGRLSIASSTASARESVQAKRIPPNTLAEGMHIFTTWKQDCKRDDVRLGSLAQRAARISADGAITDRGPCRLTRGPPPEAPVQPLSARPPETARNSRGARPPRHISVPSTVVPADAVANSSELQSARTELAYHQEQAAIQRRFLEEMINETKLRLNLGSAAASRATTARAPGTPSESTRVSTANAETHDAALQQGAATAAEYGAAAAVVVPDQDAYPDDSTDADPDMGDGTSTRGQFQRLNSVCHEDKGGREDREMTHDGVQELAEKAEDARPHSLVQREVQRQTESDTYGLAHSKMLTDGVEADTAAFEEEMLLAALHMATNEEPEKHRLALKGILPELETEEQQYFLKVISDLRRFGEEEDASEADTYVVDSYLSNLLHT